MVQQQQAQTSLPILQAWAVLQQQGVNPSQALQSAASRYTEMMARGQLILSRMQEESNLDLNNFVSRRMAELDQNRSPLTTPGYGGPSRFAPRVTEDQVKGSADYRAFASKNEMKLRHAGEDLAQQGIDAANDLRNQGAMEEHGNQMRAQSQFGEQQGGAPGMGQRPFGGGDEGGGSGPIAASKTGAALGPPKKGGGDDDGGTKIVAQGYRRNRGPFDPYEQYGSSFTGDGSGSYFDMQGFKSGGTTITMDDLMAALMEMKKRQGG